MVYCRSDAACLCLSCDRNVHSANALSKRHSRTLLCERCSSQPAFVRCVEERISLCQNCDWMGHGGSTPASKHKRQAINCYSGCPSAAELSTIWSFILDRPSGGDSVSEQELGLNLMSISENSATNRSDPTERKRRQELSVQHDANDALNLDSSSVQTSSMPSEHKSVPYNVGHQGGSANSTLPKLCCPATKVDGVEDLYDDLNMDEVDMNLDNYEELFGVAFNHSEELFENGGIDSLFGLKDGPNCQGGEGSSVQVTACSNAASGDSMMSSKTEPMLCFTTKQAHSNLSFSGVTGESSGDYQDCGASSMLVMGEPPWCPPCAESSSYQAAPASRSDAVMRYKKKKEARTFAKTVRYASRKARADVRRRVKGRFVKAGDAYDYDPLSQTRSF